LFPSLGYFGGIAASHLSITVDGPVRGIRLSLPPGATGRVDLRGLELFRDGRKVAVDLRKVTVTQSSDDCRGSSRRNPFTYGDLRTLKEKDPWWEARFDQPVDADTIRIYNRRDGHGARRSLRLVVAVADDDGYDEVYCGQSDDAVVQTAGTLSALSEVALDVADLGDEGRAHALREQILAGILRRMSRGVPLRGVQQRRHVAALIPTRRPAPGQGPTDAEWSLLGYLLASERHALPATATSVKSFSHVLGSRTALDRLADEVNRAGELLGSPTAVVTRHGIRDLGVLRRDRDAHLDLMERAAAVLRECGHDMLLSNGTLLGAVREGDFLAYDDDIDVMVPVDAAGPLSGEPELQQLQDELATKGWSVFLPNAHTNFHLVDRQTRMRIDVFPMFVDGETTTMTLNGMRMRAIPTRTVLPTSTIGLHGHTFHGPADPAAYLTEMYGSTWNVPDPYHDWPWPLDDDAALATEP
jgi:hypothetical protein